MAGASAGGVIARPGEAVHTAAPPGDPPIGSFTPDELRDIREYNKLLQFRDEIISGQHPRIKPAHLPGKTAQKASLTPAPTSTSAASPTASQPATAKRAVIGNGNARSQQTNQLRAQGNTPLGVPGLGILSSSVQASGPGKPEINPVLLEKSDDLVKAEIQLQRQRVERSLREQVEQRRGATKASDQLAELDVADIMAKAMSLVLATPLAQSTDDTPAANATASNESADDDTFYSSRHDTPESNMASRLPNESEDEEMREESPYEPALDLGPVVPQIQPVAAVTGSVQSSLASGQILPGLSIPGGSTTSQPSQVPSAPAAMRNEISAAGHPGGVQDVARVNDRHNNQAAVREPTLVRSHDLSPLAPQPTHHVMPQAIAREAHLGSSELPSGPQAAPAQVAALRKQTSNGSSPESSPHSSKNADKKKGKKKKRKADRLAADTAAASPYIKPEPRSPSPLTPQYARPNKRQRHSQQQPVEIQDDEPRYEQPVPAEESYDARYQPRVVRQERVVGYERADEYRPHHGEEPLVITSPRYERIYYDDYRAPPPQSGYPAAGPEPAQYVSREVRTVRPAPRVVESLYDDGATYYRDVRASSRMSVRPPAHPDRSQSPVAYERPSVAMPPPRTAPRRIIVDAFGREYLEPIRPATVVREEVVAEPRGAYERAVPPRAVSHRPEPLDDDTLLYHPTSPVYTAPRRVVTQPEYSYRESAVASGAMPPPPVEYRTEPTREYISRPSSVRPPMESIRYDAAPSGYERVPAFLDEHPPSMAPREYYRRPASTRPVESRYDYPPVAHAPLRSASVRPASDAPVRYEIPREYASSTVPGAAGSGAYYQQQDARRDAIMPPPPPGRAYSVMPGDQIARREFPAGGSGGTQAHPQPQPQQPAERYYAHPGGASQAQISGRDDEEVVFLERGPHVVREYR
ncbi:hypothetical protein B0J18DRAFT_442784 [Chaetomium sp. MPI-SDFR-AT-0129]|nr:hypothetical protein B0J18DRAFT_442784 [Chaetomium sp. MPI-SDFR-AT-0129]